MFPVKPVYSFVYTGPKMGKRKGTRDVASPLSIGSSGGRIRTSDLRVMSPTCGTRHAGREPKALLYKFLYLARQRGNRDVYRSVRVAILISRLRHCACPWVPVRAEKSMT